MIDNVRTVKVADGLGFGEGAISFAAGKSRADAEMLARVEAFINTPGVVLPVDEDGLGKLLADDGCGDGRPVGRVLQGSTQLRHSLNRAKVFGGGATMTAAMLIGLGQAVDKSLTDVFAEAMRLLAEHQLDFGAHTDDHAAAPKSGCGAIDNAPVIVQAAVRYRDAITQVLQTLQVPSDDLGEVMDAFAAYATTLTNASDYTGRAVMDQISEQGKVVKELQGDHREMYIVLNTLPGTTLNQAAFRELSNAQVQAFGVDLWRLHDLAQQFETPEQQRAFLSELVYTLATAAVLTAGDLPVYVVQSAA